LTHHQLLSPKSLVRNGYETHLYTNPNRSRVDAADTQSSGLVVTNPNCLNQAGVLSVNYQMAKDSDIELSL
ncbi:MAG: hypothetical protein JAY64_08985, partial [Candidatus Thiodiazotropha weberae]|nr:hypothetical protein [Candidatus Thiodiazotropha lotti]MCW4211288.1 hypothetical protein [Candidatus Thiodiazotropha lotti]